MTKHQSKIEKLIAEKCPKGVVFKELAEVGHLIRGNGLQKKDFTETGVPAIHYGQIYTYYKAFTNQTKSFVSEEHAKKLKKAKSGAVLISGVSENIQDVMTPLGWLGVGDVAISGDMFAFQPNNELDTKFLTYILLTTDFQKYKERYAQGAKVIRVKSEKLLKYKIPIPPLEIQQEIVNILDNFTELETELETELKARRKQYEHYRSELLTFNERERVRWATISEICQISRGRVMSKDYLTANAGEYPVYSSQTANEGVFGRINTFDYDGEYITWTTDGANAGSIFYRNGKFSITNVCGLLKVKTEEVNAKYLAYILSTVTKKYVSTGMGNPKLMSNVMAGVKVQIPSLSEQERIVSILDNFHTLVSDISVGLPAEISARRKQYEHYRGLLLTFPEYVS